MFLDSPVVMMYKKGIGLSAVLIRVLSKKVSGVSCQHRIACFVFLHVSQFREFLWGGWGRLAAGLVGF
jgi:hypothetical protein